MDSFLETHPDFQEEIIKGLLSQVNSRKYYAVFVFPNTINERLVVFRGDKTSFKSKGSARDRVNSYIYREFQDETVSEFATLEWQQYVEKKKQIVKKIAEDLINRRIIEIREL